MEYLLVLLKTLEQYKDGATALRDLSLAVAGLVSLLFLVIRSWAMSVSARAAQLQTQIAHDGSFNEQFIESLNLIGSEKIGARVGGIYGLGAVAETSPRFRSQSLRVLSISLRNKSHLLELSNSKSERRDLRIEIQSILNSLGRIQRSTELPEVYDFSELRLSGYVFRGDFSNSIFKNSSLIDCNFDKANLNGSKFDVTSFVRTKFYDCSILGCELQGAMFKGARFTRTDLSTSEFAEGVFESIKFKDSNLKKTKFLGCSFHTVSIKGSNCNYADFTKEDIPDESDLSTFFKVLVSDSSFFRANFSYKQGAILNRIKGSQYTIVDQHEMPPPSDVIESDTSYSYSLTAPGHEVYDSDSPTSWLTVYSDSDAVVQADEVDPIAEADVYLAYGRTEQAIEVLEAGYQQFSERIDILEKLLVVYRKENDEKSFREIAKKLYPRRSELSPEFREQVSEAISAEE